MRKRSAQPKRPKGVPADWQYDYIWSRWVPPHFDLTGGPSTNDEHNRWPRD